jgi:hypothetical protein
MAVLERTAPGHVETVRASLFDHLSEDQVGQLEEICAQIAGALDEGGSRPTPDEVPWRRRSAPPCS